jgi:hypothetical protein
MLILEKQKGQPEITAVESDWPPTSDLRPLFFLTLNVELRTLNLAFPSAFSPPISVLRPPISALMSSHRIQTLAV